MTHAVSLVDDRSGQPGRSSGAFGAQGRVSVATGDVDELRSIGSAVFSPHELEYRGELAQLSAVGLERITLVRMRYRGDATVTTTEDLGYYAVHLPIAGFGVVRFAQESVQTSPRGGVVFNPGDRPSMSWSADLDQFGIKVPVGVLRDHLGSLLGSPASDALFRVRRGAQGAGGWEAAARTVAAAAGGSPTAGARRRLADMFLTALLFSQPGSWSSALRDDRRSAPRSAISRAVERVEAEPAGDWTIATLAEVAGVSARSLHEGFRRDLGTTPMRFVRDARLECARLLLERTDGVPVSVADIASTAGFAHLGRFAGFFRERYGTSPSQLLRAHAAGATGQTPNDR